MKACDNVGLVATKKIAGERLEHLLLSLFLTLISRSQGWADTEKISLTLALTSPLIDTRACYQHIIDYRETTFTANPYPILVFYLAIVEYRGFV